jgi:hypothetical protein
MAKVKTEQDHAEQATIRAIKARFTGTNPDKHQCYTWGGWLKLESGHSTTITANEISSELTLEDVFQALKNVPGMEVEKKC